MRDGIAGVMRMFDYQLFLGPNGFQIRQMVVAASGSLRAITKVTRRSAVPESKSPAETILDFRGMLPFGGAAPL